MLTKAIAFVQQSSSTFREIKWFYRAKPHEYFEDIFQYHNSIMRVHLKDHNGDAASIINGTLSGLFFACNVNKRGHPPHISIYGPKRLYVPAGIIMFPDSAHLYFADFYCLRSVHYVTLIMTVCGSKSDQFCHEHLVMLNKQTNAFLVRGVTIGGLPCVLVTGNVWVEVFYTEDINLYYWMKVYGSFFKTVESIGTSKAEGVPKNVSCTVCNL